MFALCDFTASRLKLYFIVSTIRDLIYRRLDVSFLFFIAGTGDDITVEEIQGLVHNHPQAHRILTFYIHFCIKPTLVHGASVLNGFQFFSWFLPFIERKRIIC